MVPLAELWLPIVVSAVVVFFASFIAWTVLPHHRSDWSELPDQAGFLENLGGQGPKPGQYTFPHCAKPSEMQDPDYLAKLDKGPVGYLIVIPNGPPKMAKSLTLFFLYCVLISTFVAYLTGQTLASGTDYIRVFQIAGAVAVLGYCMALIQPAIWFGRTWSSIGKEIADGAVYGLLTAGVFGWLWPS